MANRTVSEYIEQLRQPEPDERARKVAILEQIPGELSAPSICFHDSYASLAFRSPAYDPDKSFDPVQHLRRLEGSGWASAGMMLVKWDNYRPSPLPAQDPDTLTHKRYTLSDWWPAVNLWVEWNGHTQGEARTWMRSPSGDLVQIHIDFPCPHLVHARRQEFRGGWRYVDGRLAVPERWEMIPFGDEHIAQRHHRTRFECGPHYSPQSMDASVYWEMIVNTGEPPASCILEHLVS